MDLIAIANRMAEKGIVPGETECIMVIGHLPGVVACQNMADGVVVEHRHNKDVVLAACSQHRYLFMGDNRFTVVSFDAIAHAVA